MSDLGELQEDFTRYLLDQPNAMAERAQGSRRADVGLMLNVYRHAYAARLLEVLATDYPKLKALAGEAMFDQLGRAYIAAHPSRSFSARWFGGELPGFLAATSPFSEQPALAAMATFEWALATAFDAADAPAEPLAALAAVPPTAWPGMRLHPHPTLVRIDLVVDVPGVWRRLDRGEAAGAIPEATGAPAAWLVWRIGLDVKFRALPADEAWAIDAMRRGEDFAAICEGLCGFVEPDRAAFRAAELVKTWIEADTIGRLDYQPDMSA